LTAGVIFVVVVGVVLLYVILKYNGLVRLRNRCENAWRQIDVQLRRRYDLIPNLVETVKGYAKHERKLFEAVTNARAAAIAAGNVKDQAKAENVLTGALRSLFAVAENYPQLKANENFKLLQEELAGTEGKIAFARQFYNDQVMLFNNAIQVFPANVIAGTFSFRQRDYFELEDAGAREPVKVKF